MQATIGPYFALKVSKACAHVAIRLRRRNALVQRITSLTRESQLSVASNCQAGFCSQGIKNPAYMPLFAFGVASRLYSAMRASPAKQALGCKQLSGHISLSRYQKSGVHAAIRLRHRIALVQRNASFTRKTGPRLQATIGPYFALKVSKIRRTCRRSLMDFTFWMMLLSLYYPFAFFGVLRTYYRHRRFASRLLSAMRD